MNIRRNFQSSLERNKIYHFFKSFVFKYFFWRDVLMNAEYVIPFTRDQFSIPKCWMCFLYKMGFTIFRFNFIQSQNNHTFFDNMQFNIIAGYLFSLFFAVLNEGSMVKAFVRFGHTQYYKVCWPTVFVLFRCNINPFCEPSINLFPNKCPRSNIFFCSWKPCCFSWVKVSITIDRNCWFNCKMCLW